MDTLTKYEVTRVVGTRSHQIALGSKPCIDIGEMTDCYEIALEEMRQNKIPIILTRHFPGPGKNK